MELFILFIEGSDAKVRRAVFARGYLEVNNCCHVARNEINLAPTASTRSPRLTRNINLLLTYYYYIYYIYYMNLLKNNIFD